MNYKNLVNRILPHLGIVAIFIALSFAYFSPVLKGKTLPQMDNIHAEGMSKELKDFEASHKGEVSLWTNSMFGGMPAYQIYTGKSYNVFNYCMRVLRLGMPGTTVAIIFILLLGFYILLVSLKFDKWLCLAGAIAFAFASYNIIIIGAGHLLKAYAIAYMPAVLAGIILVLNRRYIAGAILSVLFLGIEFACNHPQITYYLMFTIGIIFFVYLIYALIKKEMKHWVISACIVGGSVLLAIAPSASYLWTTYEYGKESIRGGSEVVTTTNKEKTSGLDRNYALAWSYGVAESFTMLVPNFMGGESDGFDENSETAAALREAGVQKPEQFAKSYLKRYWGDMPFTSGPVYFGAIVCFLFVLGLFLVKGPHKWWLIAVAVITLFLSWGRNFMPFTNLFFDYFPMYNKFRTVSMILVVTNLSMLLLGFLGLKELWDDKVSRKKAMTALWISAAITAGIVLSLVLIVAIFVDPTAASDDQLFQALTANKWPADLIDSIREAVASDRQALLRADAFRSIAFIALAAGLLWAFISKKLKPLIFALILGFLILVDLWQIDRRYLNNDSFVSKKQAKATFEKSQADDFILKDTDPDFRVLNLSGGIERVFNDGYTPYYHKSVGGYHGAKMSRYQDIIDRPLGDDIRLLGQAFATQSIDTVNMVLPMLHTLNMLNTRYVIYNPGAMPLINMQALGAAWFVDSVHFVGSPTAELASLNKFNPAITAVVDTKFKEALKDYKEPSASDTIKGIIKLTQYEPNHLIYETNAARNELAVFSEIYYDKGWNAYIDGKEVPHLRANYVLRALMVPAGQHKVEFKFEPKSFAYGQKIALVSSILIVLGILFFSWREIKKNPAVKEEEK